MEAHASVEGNDATTGSGTRSKKRRRKDEDVVLPLLDAGEDTKLVAHGDYDSAVHDAAPDALAEKARKSQRKKERKRENRAKLGRRLSTQFRDAMERKEQSSCLPAS
jgi:hypothetical protein